MKQLLIYLSFMLFLTVIGNSQTVGLIQHDTASFDDGYVLLAPVKSKNTYLIDKCGRLIKTWNSLFNTGMSAYLLPDGTLFRTADVNNPTFVTAGQGGRVEKIDWNSNVTWSYTISDSVNCQHHDAKVMPNGNVLIIAWELKTNSEAIAQGRNPALVPSTLWSEQVLEVQPVGTNGGIVVWEWHLWDHMVQHFDSLKPNYGIIASNPQLLNLNYAGNATNPDWIHMNAIDYNSDLDQILLSSHNTNEIWIIDHSSTTAQAAGHTGGNSGKGGDLLWRWGNPQAYGHGTTVDQKFFGQHNAYWIESGMPYAHQIMVYNNGIARPGGNYTTVEIVDPPVSGFNYNAALPYLPDSVSWIYNDGNPNNYFANNVSGAQQLPNGNVIMCNGRLGTFDEVTGQGTRVWEYINPVSLTGILAQGSVPTQNLVFRSPFYTTDYSGFSGHTLTPGSTIENSNTMTANCILNTGIDELTDEAIHIFPNPATDLVSITGLTGETKLYNSLGVEIWSGLPNDALSINISAYRSGLYFIRNGNTVSKLIIVK
jgi:hypothetical protein